MNKFMLLALTVLLRCARVLKARGVENLRNRFCLECVCARPSPSAIKIWLPLFLAVNVTVFAQTGAKQAPQTPPSEAAPALAPELAPLAAKHKAGLAVPDQQRTAAFAAKLPFYLNPLDTAEKNALAQSKLDAVGARSGLARASPGCVGACLKTLATASNGVHPPPSLLPHRLLRVVFLPEFLGGLGGGHFEAAATGKKDRHPACVRTKFGYPFPCPPGLGMRGTVRPAVVP